MGKLVVFRANQVLHFLYIDLGCVFVGKPVIFRANQVLHLLIYYFGMRFCGKIGYISCETTNSFA